MGSPGTQVYTGTFIATGSQLDVDKVGFKPRSVDLYVGGLVGHWQDDMPDASAYKRLANGTGSLVTSAGITPRPNGFRLGADSDLNTNGGVVRFVAYS